MRGGIGLVRSKDQDLPIPRIVAEGAGPFHLQIPVPPDRGNVILYQSSAATEARLRAQWQASADAISSAPEELTRSAAEKSPIADTQPEMKNLAERIGDWTLFGKGVIESPQAFLFGHEKPIPREIRTSAHNFYIDFAYNFGTLALVPLLGLMGYTGMLLWRRRRQVVGDDALFMHAAMLIFLLLIECNLKVTLRQPYPGIAIYFLWGFLLARLQALDSNRADRSV
jgi:hypothetical protein